MTRIKICGIRDPRSLDVAIREGVHAIGFLFHEPSVRSILPVEARSLASDIPPFVSRVGVFVEQDKEHILDIAYSVGLDSIQLHHEQYDEDFVQKLKQEWPFSVIRVVRTPSLDDKLVQTVQNSLADAILFDTWNPHTYGGTGTRFSISLSSSQKTWLSTKGILAGGIRRENIEEVLTYHPYAIDISSGVEKKKGVKDPLLIQELLKTFYRLHCSPA